MLLTILINIEKYNCQIFVFQQGVNPKLWSMKPFFVGALSNF